VEKYNIVVIGAGSGGLVVATGATGLGGPLFTHWAGHQARVVIRSILVPGSTKHELANLPWTTFTEPEIAPVGLNETAARAQGVAHQVFSVPFDSIHRAVCDGEAEGYFAKVVAGPKGETLRATIVHPRRTVLRRSHRLREGGEVMRSPALRGQAIGEDRSLRQLRVDERLHGGPLLETP
jgi:pyruvate/2-oxoglutarate dehydrogenase complex dihydrolipoamide dehydrogenase (E3) component